jgi:hypothetical protein
MKAKTICLSLLVLAGAAAAAHSESFRTDINPALIYGRAFLLAPDLGGADSDYLFTNNWQGHRFPERASKLLSQYDNEFKLVCQAAHSTVPCDWGIDMSPGPGTLLPGLARAKAVAVTAKLRVMWHLQNGREADAREELLASFALARNAALDGTVISTLVQIAMEAINCSSIAGNFGRFSPETLQQLADALDGPPPRHAVVECVPIEKAFFLDWVLHKIQELQRQNPGNDARVLEGLRQLVEQTEGEEGQPKLWPRLLQASGGTSEGILRLFHEREELSERAASILSLPYAQYKKSVTSFLEEIDKSGNPLAQSATAFTKSRQREFRILATLAMVRAAVAYKLQGASGLQTVTDPCGEGPFVFERFVFEGVDRGFQLKSAFDLDNNVATLIFVEKDGPPFQVDGNYPGRPLPKESPKD